MPPAPRPPGITRLATFQGGLASLGLAVWGLSMWRLDGVAPMSLAMFAVLCISVLPSGAIAIVGSICLWHGKAVGWWLSALLYVSAVINSLWVWAGLLLLPNDLPAPADATSHLQLGIWVTIALAIILYLFTSRVRRFCQIGRAHV